MKKIVMSTLCMIFLLFLSAGVWANSNDQDINLYDTDNQIPPYTVLRGIITYVGPYEEDTEHQFYLGRQDFRVRITSKGKFYGKEFELENVKMGHPLYDLDLRVGQRVLLYAELSGDEIINIGIQSYARDYYIYILVGIFVVVLLLIGGLKGFKALITLTIMGIVIILGLLPLILKGYNPLILAISFSSLIAVLTLFIIGGVNNKSLAATFGVIGGLIVAGALAVIFGKVAHLTGFSSEEAQMLSFIDEAIKIDIQGLLFAGIIIGTLGAVLDVGMSVASSMAEIQNSLPEIKPVALLKAGMNVGRDIMGTMVNTLILAYTGSSLPLLLIFRAYETSYDRIINMDLIATEVVRSIVGSLGLILTIPLTASFYILLISKGKRG
ncbi:YibE/F family protein [Anaerobranca gottschalkii]|uniref:Uncharacterized membrane protein n=1 Tax=Anaerobranca gottschalkii DSM 13577 TaxID=1120990 RepID=A0A1I0BKV4_9FIRM|nr:YibE/F family protein [Anaerobranca gottschalkii]SET07637.1 Uncharacterized membrane protein [Anaerobranca gottschalkii DSM 13577]